MAGRAKYLRMSFDEWLRATDLCAETKYGLSLADLPDCCYRDWYDAGYTPSWAARAAVRFARSDGYDL